VSQSVLIVDDDRQMLLSLAEGLARYAPELEVVTAGDGAQALEHLQHREVALVVTDLKMPRMDGFELLTAIMRSYPDVPVIIVTGFSTPDMEQRSLSGGAVEFVAKPFRIDRLAVRIQAMLKRASEGGTLHKVSPGMFLQLIEMEQKSCVIRVEDASGARRGAIFFLQGRLVDARVGALQGEPAAYEIFGWEPVSLSIQNGCSIRERRIFKDLNAIVIESARRQDELRVARPGPAVPEVAPTTDALAPLRARLAKAFGGAPGVGRLHTDETWDYRLKRVSQAGERLGFGVLRAAYVEKLDGSGAVLVPTSPTRVLPVSGKSPRDRLLRFVESESGAAT
jgi:DNA-binding response OmpR family regulator